MWIDLIWFTFSSIHGFGDCFYFWDVMNNVAVNILCASSWVNIGSVFLGVYLGVELLGQFSLFWGWVWSSPEAGEWSEWPLGSFDQTKAVLAVPSSQYPPRPLSPCFRASQKHRNRVLWWSLADRGLGQKAGGLDSASSPVCGNLLSPRGLTWEWPAAHWGRGSWGLVPALLLIYQVAWSKWLWWCSSVSAQVICEMKI